MGKGSGIGLIAIRECESEESIVFVHGLNGHSLKTWTKKNFEPLPKLLSNDDSFKRFNIYTFGYKTSFFLNSHSIKDIADLLFTEITAKIPSQRVLFVTHSMGGLIVRKMLCEQVESSNQPFINLAKGIVYMAVPFAGAEIARVVDRVGSLFVPGFVKNSVSRQVVSLKTFSEDLYDLNVRWVRYRQSKQLQLIEKVIKGVSDKTVDVASSHDPYIQDVSTVEADHISICKVDSESTVYVFVKRKVDHLANRIVDHPCIDKH